MSRTNRITEPAYAANLAAKQHARRVLRYGLFAPPADWKDVLCAEVDPEAFFPEPGGDTRPAKKICGRCGDKDKCAEQALTRREPYGVWGGLTERDRRRALRLRDQENLTQGGTDAAAA